MSKKMCVNWQKAASSGHTLIETGVDVCAQPNRKRRACCCSHEAIGNALDRKIDAKYIQP
jgi:hypothetical protein